MNKPGATITSVRYEKSRAFRSCSLAHQQSFLFSTLTQTRQPTCNFEDNLFIHLLLFYSRTINHCPIVHIVTACAPYIKRDRRQSFVTSVNLAFLFFPPSSYHLLPVNKRHSIISSDQPSSSFFICFIFLSHQEPIRLPTTTATTRKDAFSLEHSIFGLRAGRVGR